MSQEASSYSAMIIDNIKHEPPVEYLLILPPEQNETERKDKTSVKRKTKSEKTFKCEKCPHVTKYKSNLVLHSKRCGKNKLIKPVNIFQCDLCPVSSNKKSSLRKHMHVHNKLRPFACLECGQKFKNKAGLARHTGRMKELQCLPCKFECKCFYALVQHQKAHGSNIKFKCDQCSYNTISKVRLLRHKRLHVKKLSCESCEKKFSYPCDLKNHQMTHRHGIYKNLSNVSYHCAECGKMFATIKSLKQHSQLVHENLKAQCDYCLKLFKNKHYLHTHISTHLKLPCKVCKRLFSKHFLPKHIKEHFESQEYHCDLCGGQFKRRNTIKQHMVNVHPNGEYVCFLCRRRFNNIKGLLNHKKVHIGKKKFKCIKCKHVAPSNYFLKSHIKKHHG